MARFRIDEDLSEAVVFDEVSLTMPRARRRGGQGTRHRLRRLAGETSKEQVKLLDALSVSILPGQSVAVLSDRRDGAVEFLRLAAGTLIPDAGSVRRRSVVVPMLDDSRCLDATYTVRQNIYVVGSLLGMSTERVTAKLKWITENAAVGNWLDAYLRDAPKNLRQRIMWATTLATEARIFAIEESVTVGKDEFQEHCWGIMESLRADGVTFIVTASEAEVLTRFCDRALVLKDAHLAADTTVEQALTMVSLHSHRHVRLEAPADDDDDINPVV